ncbi:MAG TPA: pitrilysin family protein [Oscillatoriaceae cyanobacterium]
MPSTTYETLHERMLTETLPNGLTVHLVPKKGYSKAYAVFTTRYGSLDNHFRVDGEPEQRVPDGIAHFLEHKLFEEEWGDIFHTFATNGASANAYTSHHRTAYLFSATSKVEENLETLVDFVQRPYLTPENVEKEKGIIEQEIRMYDEMPFWRGYRHLLENLFVKSPVRIDIAGTADSIREITPKELLKCYHAFYHPSNMVLAVVGDIDAERLMTLVRENQAKKQFSPPRAIARYFEDEPTALNRARSEIRMPVSRPLILLGWKEQHTLDGLGQLRRELVMQLVQDVLFGHASALFQDLLDAGVIDESFSCDYEVGPAYGFSFIASETDEPERFETAVRETIAKAIADGLAGEDFERARRKQLGEYLHALNSPEAIANQLTEVAIKQADFFRVPELIASLTLEEANDALRGHYQLDHTAASLVLPSGEAPAEDEE